jgi:hypothetical protein
MNTARVSRNIGSAHAAGALLSPARLPVLGKVRAGIKELTAAAAKVPGAAKIYSDGIAAGASFDEIATALKGVKGIPNYPLRPVNPAYFSARQGDFSVSGAAAKLLELYGEVRQGDPPRRLYALPVVFPTDGLDLVFREAFEAWRATELVRWSENGQCMRRMEAAPDASKRRRWGGRPIEAVGPCNPNACDLFAAGDCKHVGALYFWVPGITGVGTIELSFTSVYASLGIAETIEMVRAGLGRISGLLNGKPIFWLTKSRERISRMNWETGKPEKSEHWIIKLEAAGIDMIEVMSGSTQRALPAPDAANVPVLEEPAPPTYADEPPRTQSADPRIRELRSQLIALRDTLEWDNDELAEWVDGQGYTAEHPTQDAVCLSDMVAKLTVTAKARAERLTEAEEVPF